MGFVGFLRFALKFCIDFLAWPLFALGCPLYASIRAIESNSNSDMRNLVAYWILFSLISLFELAFVKLIEWLPLWPYIKLITICWLVLPHFDGACYVYEHLVRPCLSLNPQIVINQFIKPKKDLPLNEESFLAVAERYVKDNGSEALEKLISGKSKHTEPNVEVEEIETVAKTEENETAAAIHSKHTEPNVEVEEIKAGANTEENETAAAIHSKHTEPNVEVEEIKAGANTEENETAAAIQFGCIRICHMHDKGHALSGYTLPVLQSKHTEPNVDVEKIKAVANTEENETAAAIHSKFKEPNVAKEDAKPVEQAEKNPSAATKWSEFKEPNVAKENAKAGELKEKNLADATEWVKCAEPNLAQTEKNTVAAEEIKEKIVVEENKVSEIPTSEKVQKEWACAVCQVKTSCEVNLNSHLQGKKHKAKCRELKASKQARKNKGCSSSTTNQEPKKSTFGDRLNQNKSKKQENSRTNQSRLWCSICNVNCPGEIDVASHLNGKKHLSRIQEMIDSLGKGY